MISNLVIFTDLDGTLLDNKTYEPGPALNTLKFCGDNNIPVIFVTAKTRAEIEPIRHELNNDSPFISENGGGLYLPVDGFKRPENFEKSGDYWCRLSKILIGDIRPALDHAAEKAEVKVQGFGRMTTAEIADLTGLDIDRAKLAGAREFDEPFVIIDETEEKLEAIRNEIIRAGYRYDSGGYLHHIMGDFNKGETVNVLITIYKRIKPTMKFIGLGDAYNDLPMLKLVDYPFLVRRPDGTADSRVDFEGLTITDGIGPLGFVEAVESAL
ncbi:MAG: HAD-IIB family hydrolase [candidate division Zixibacteria bacterium]|nr:HAD-IIB family hydrolase [candidate division Zixibacteria bacterium]